MGVEAVPPDLFAQVLERRQPGGVQGFASMP